ncbi:MAG: AtpZ/AtpI family protein [Fluviicola sp.]|jgi:hypothetical protein
MFQIKKNKSTNKVNTYLRFTGLAFQMGLTIYLMSLLGNWLDFKYPSNLINYTKVLTLFAVFGSTFSIIRQVIKLGKEEDSNDKKNNDIENDK